MAIDKSSFNILALSGSSRTSSTNVRILEYIAGHWRLELNVELFSTADDLPFFSPDRDGDHVPESIKVLRNKIAKADGIIICTPEYVFSPPAVLKNVIEWMVSVTVLSDKPCALIVAAASGEKSMESLTLMLDTVGVKTLPETRILLQGIRGKINAEGEFTDESVKDQISACVLAFIQMLK